MSELHWTFKRYVYALLHPKTWEVRYIGVTQNVQKRVRQHVTLAPRNLRDEIAHPVSDWIRSLNGLDPRYRILEPCERKDAKAREAWWIAKYHAEGKRLLNIQKKTFSPHSSTSVPTSDHPTQLIGSSRKDFT